MINLGLWLRQDDNYFSHAKKERFCKWFTITLLGNMFQVMIVWELITEFLRRRDSIKLGAAYIKAGKIDEFKALPYWLQDLIND